VISDFILGFLAAAVPLPPSPADVTFNGKLEQGGLAVAVAPLNSTVEFNGRTFKVTDDGRFLVGFDRDAPESMSVTVTGPDGVSATHTLKIAPRQWQIDRVDGLPPSLVTPDPETEKRIAADGKIMAAVRARTEPAVLFNTGFVRPASGRISGVYGSQRILNGEPRAPHVGLDIAGPIGTPVKAAADGIVSLAKADMVLTGQTVVLEHGGGLDTVYIHMSEIAVTDGQHVKQGDVIGKIGMTGRANGPHLHFGATWYDTRLDPETVLTLLAER